MPWVSEVKIFKNCLRSKFPVVALLMQTCFARDIYIMSQGVGISSEKHVQVAGEKRWPFSAFVRKRYFTSIHRPRERIRQ